MPGNRRLWTLTLVHVVVGIVASAVAPFRISWGGSLRQIIPPLGVEQILIVPLVASVLGQAVLLSVWVVGSTGSLVKRVAGLVAGGVFLESLLVPVLRHEFLGLVTVTAGVSTISLILIRATGIQISRTDQAEEPAQGKSEGFQISIRGLMIFTALVAILSAGAKAMQVNSVRFFLLSALWGLCFVTVGIASLWATLGAGRPHRRWPVVMVLSPTLGGFFAHAVRAHTSGRSYIILTMLSFAVVLLGSLEVVRSCGYRIIRRADQPQSPDLIAQT